MKIFQKNKYSSIQNLAKLVPIFIIGFCLIFPPIVSVHAQDCDKNGLPKGCTPIKTDTNVTPIKTDTNVTPGNKINTGIGNPLENAGVSDITSFIESILRFVVMIGIPIITLAIIYSGFLFVVARGNPEELKKAKKTFLYTLVGAALLLGSFVIANAIKGTVDQIKS